MDKPAREEIAGMIDHSLLHPALTDSDLREGIALAAGYRVASVCIKPYAVAMAAGLLQGEQVKVCTVAGFPHGNSRVDVKLFEARRAVEDGADEIDAVVNIGKVLSGEWDYIDAEVGALAEFCREQGSLLKIIFENDLLPDDGMKIRLCGICNRHRVDFVKTSTGYGFVKDAAGHYAYRGAVDSDLVLMRKHTDPGIQVKAAGGIRSLRDVMRVRELGVTRIGATATAAILDALED